MDSFKRYKKSKPDQTIDLSDPSGSTKPKAKAFTKSNNLSSTNSRNNRSQKTNLNSARDWFAPLNWPRYISFKFRDESKIPSACTMLAWEFLALHFNITDPKVQINKTGFVAYAPTQAISEQLLKLTNFAGYTVTPSAKCTYNQRIGTVLVNHFEANANTPKDDVIRIAKLSLTKQGYIIDDIEYQERPSFKTGRPVRTLRITFNQPEIPRNVRFNGGSVPVKEILPTPLQCRKCLRYGHTKNHCRSTISYCTRCSEALTDTHPQNCTSDPRCINCQDSHHAYNRTCKHFLYHQEVRIRMLKYGLSKRQAKEDMKQEGRSLNSPLLSEILNANSQTNNAQPFQQGTHIRSPQTTRTTSRPHMTDTMAEIQSTSIRQPELLTKSKKPHNSKIKDNSAPAHPSQLPHPSTSSEPSHNVDNVWHTVSSTVNWAEEADLFPQHSGPINISNKFQALSTLPPKEGYSIPSANQRLETSQNWRADAGKLPPKSASSRYARRSKTTDSSTLSPTKAERRKLIPPEPTLYNPLSPIERRTSKHVPVDCQPVNFDKGRKHLRSDSSSTDTPGRQRKTRKQHKTSKSSCQSDFSDISLDESFSLPNTSEEEIFQSMEKSTTDNRVELLKAVEKSVQELHDGSFTLASTSSSFALSRETSQSLTNLASIGTLRDCSLSRELAVSLHDIPVTESSTTIIDPAQQNLNESGETVIFPVSSVEVSTCLTDKPDTTASNDRAAKPSILSLPFPPGHGPNSQLSHNSGSPMLVPTEESSPSPTTNPAHPSSQQPGDDTVEVPGISAEPDGGSSIPVIVSGSKDGC